MKNQEQKTPENKQSKLFLKLAVIIIAVSALAYFAYRMLKVSFLPTKYTLISVAVCGLIIVTTAFFLLKKKKRPDKYTDILLGVLNLVLSACLVVIPMGVNKVEDTIDTLFELPKTGTSDMIFVALATDNISSPEQLFNDKVAVQQTDDLDNQAYAINYLEIEYKRELPVSPYEDVVEAIDDLLAGKCRFVLLNQSYFDSIVDNEAYETLPDKTKVVYKVEILYDLEDVYNNAKVTEESFNILVSGADNYGKIKNIYRSDVNILVTVNPKTKQILVTSIPRDAYVKVPCWNNAYDKLTHASAAGWRSPKGVKCSMKTVEKFLDTKIDFYILINFSSVINIVDTIGGITIENPYDFTYSYKPKTFFPKGTLNLDGRDTLYYVRERKSSKKGDMGRNEHQIIVLKAMLKKILQPSMLSKANQLFVELSNSYQTNFSSEQISALIKMQLSDLASWDVLNQSLQGQTARKLSAILSKYQVFSMTVVFPNQLKQAKKNIKAVLSGNILESAELPEGIKQKITNDTPKKKPKKTKPTEPTTP